MVVHSQGFYGYQQSNIPIYVGITLLVGFPFFLRYIFIQDCSINRLSSNLPDGTNYVGTGTAEDAAKVAAGEKIARTPATAVEAAKRLEDKTEVDCRIEKYGGIQMMLCASLIIMVLTKTKQRKDKALAFGIMILLTYGLSQTFIRGEVYNI